MAGDNTLIVLFPDEPRWNAGSTGSTPSQPSIEPALEATRPMNKVVLAYSGGLDTSVAVAWLKEQYGVDVVTLTVDVGGGSLREGVERRAMSAGAAKAYVVDARETFVIAVRLALAPGRTRSTRACTRWPRRSPGR